MESNIFWWTLYIYPLLWLLFSVGSVFGFNLQWLIIDIVALVLNGANVYGYSKCNSEAKTKLQNMAGNFITQQVCHMPWFLVRYSLQIQRCSTGLAP
jgi:fumarate reductase subunit D